MDISNIPQRQQPMFRTRIKFCGMTRPQDLQLATALGIDAIGFIFAAGSSRQLEPAQAQTLRKLVPPLVDVVSLFRNNTLEQIHTVITTVRPSLLQFHGEETNAFCQQFGLPWMKAIAMGDGTTTTAQQLHNNYPQAAGFLFDGHASGQAGGSGQVFDWSYIPTNLQTPFWLAGGIRPDNVAQAITSARPWAVDVASGIESTPGIKDARKMRAFVEQVRLADTQSGI